MNAEIVKGLEDLIGEDWVLHSLEQTKGYLYDETEELIRPVASEDSIVVKPNDAKEISVILKYANQLKLPVVPRGGGTGLCGGAIPTKQSIILSLERLNKSIEVDEENLMVTCDAGVTLSALLDKLKEYDNLFFPVHPGDECAHIGGMVVQNAGGARAVRHGIMRNHVKGLEVVFPTGEITNLGGKLIKNNSGLDLLHLMIGSEGILGIVTKVILKLYPEPEYSGTLLISFDSRDDAISVVPKILQRGIIPLAIEYMERDVALASAEHIGEKWPSDEGIVDLIVILSEDKEDSLYEKSEEIVDICDSNNAVYTSIAESNKEQHTILAVRSNVYTAVSHDAVDGLDMAVPIGSIANFMKEIFELADKYGAKTPSVGHAGDGNIHNFIMRENGEIPPYYEELKESMYRIAVKYGGTITAEHGIGKTRLKNLGIQLSEKEIEIIKGIKKVFDPNGILNPGTVIDIK